MKKIVLVVSMVFVLWSLIMPVVSEASAKEAAIGGSFITGDLCSSWTDARWQQEFSAMKNAGMQYVVIQAVANSYPGKVTEMLYPSSLPNTQKAYSKDIVDACLRNAESAGMKVFIGIDMSDEWWNVYGNDTTWLYNQMTFDNKVCDELWTLYKSKYPDAFYGWYWSYEVDNANWTTSTQQAVLMKAMNMQLDHLTSANERLPFMWCPFMNSRLGTAQAYETMWKNVLAGLHTTTGDVFCPQDCVGAGGLTLDQVTTWFSALRQAVDAKPGLVMWSDVETFQGYNNSFISADMGRVVTQLKMEQPYVDDYVTWEYCYYDSPYNTAPGFYETYLDYLKNGSVETSAPSTPDEFTATLQPGGGIALNWDASTDNIGVCGYNVYRNGNMIGKLQVQAGSGGTADTVVPTSFADAGVSPNTKYTYQVDAYDFAGNVSALTSPDTVAIGNYKIVSHGCGYTVSAHPSNNYPDPNGKKLTDGTFASAASYADPAWVGFISTDTLNVVIDLGQSTSVQQFLGEYLLDPQPAVYLPNKVVVSLSTDNVTFTNAETMVDNAAGNSSQSVHKYYYLLSSPVSARYVKFSTISPNGAWIFVDEYEVFDNSTTNVQQQLQSAPGKFDLSNNYPNPFNPSTSIKVSLVNNGMMSLKIYNILGQLVKVVDQSYKPAGEYTYNVTMDNFASGVYFYSLQQGQNMMTRKMILMK